MPTPFWQEGLHFGCTRCSACCRHDPGFVFLSGSDIERLLKHLALPFRAFLDKYTRAVDVGTGWSISLREKPGYDCIFWHADGCAVYGARPVQCSTYPFWPGVLDSLADWRSEAASCPGIDAGPLLDGACIKSRLMARIDNKVLVLDYALCWETVDENTVLGRPRLSSHAD
jgi:uncharacterized protein